jgi:hypothetical protein
VSERALVRVYDAIRRALGDRHATDEARGGCLVESEGNFRALRRAAVAPACPPAAAAPPLVPEKKPTAFQFGKRPQGRHACSPLRVFVAAASALLAILATEQTSIAAPFT